MRTLYFDCSMGAAGDMLMGALYELLEDQKFYLEIMNRLFPGVTVVARPGDTFQVHGTYMDVWIDGEEEGEIEQSGSRQRFSARETFWHICRFQYLSSRISGKFITKSLRQSHGCTV